jgi:hypothetical protein
MGFLVIGDQLSTLPVGSTLDTGKGVFYWQPGLGFIGQYKFIFIEKRQNNQINRKNITVNIVPKFKKNGQYPHPEKL